MTTTAKRTLTPRDKAQLSRFTTTERQQRRLDAGITESTPSDYAKSYCTADDAARNRARRELEERRDAAKAAGADWWSGL